MTVARAQSSFADEDWLPVLEALVRGVQHSLNNRVAAIDGALSLQELGISAAGESLRTLRDEMKQLRQLLNEMRDLTPKLTPRREPGRMGDALTTAAALLSHVADAPQVTVEQGEAGNDPEPVMLWPADRVRASVLLLISAGEAAGPAAALQASAVAAGHQVRVTVEGPFDADKAARSQTYQSLVRFAAAESGECASERVGTGGARLTLTLPGMSQSS